MGMQELVEVAVNLIINPFLKGLLPVGTLTIEDNCIDHRQKAVY